MPALPFLPSLLSTEWNSTFLSRSSSSDPSIKMVILSLVHELLQAICKRMHFMSFYEKRAYFLSDFQSRLWSLLYHVWAEYSVFHCEHIPEVMRDIQGKIAQRSGAYGTWPLQLST
jgi:hypothetical protein